MSLDVNYLPQHVAIVMDGNGRWAEQNNQLRVEGHQAGTKSVKAAVRTCLKHHIPFLSLFAFSSENWSRPEEEVNALMQLFFDALSSEVDELVNNGVRLVFTGDRRAFSPALQAQMCAAENRTSGDERLTLNVCMNYGGQWDILQATRAIAEKVQQGHIQPDNIDADFFAQHLATALMPAPDLLIRTSGEHRISNYFLWQAAYSELYFTNTLWPDFDELAFEDALRDFQNRERRFGLISSKDYRESDA